MLALDTLAFMAVAAYRGLDSRMAFWLVFLCGVADGVATKLSFSMPDEWEVAFLGYLLATFCLFRRDKRWLFVAPFALAFDNLFGSGAEMAMMDAVLGWMWGGVGMVLGWTAADLMEDRNAKCER